MTLWEERYIYHGVWLLLSEDRHDQPHLFSFSSSNLKEAQKIKWYSENLLLNLKYLCVKNPWSLGSSTKLVSLLRVNTVWCSNIPNSCIYRWKISDEISSSGSHQGSYLLRKCVLSFHIWVKELYVHQLWEKKMGNIWPIYFQIMSKRRF